MTAATRSLPGRVIRAASAQDGTGGNQNYINHVVLVIDCSASMSGVAHQLIKVVDAEIAYLAERSRELDQETRVTVYVFNQQVRCLIYDKDVLRLPSIAKLYRAAGMTALLDATVISQRDLDETGQLYGDHAFLTYLFTDGQENCSALFAVGDVTRLLAELADNRTVAVLVPDQRGVHEAKKMGFPAANVAIWDATTARGVETAVTTTVRSATESWMTSRASGVRSSRTLFAGGAEQVNARTVRAAGLVPLAAGTFETYAVTGPELAIRPYVERWTGRPYRMGSAFYQLSKPETIQASKQIAVRQRSTGLVYVGTHARVLLGLPDASARVRPEGNPEFDVFVQSTSVNRKLVVGTELLVMSA